jgi:hypothetical protein
MPVGGPLVVTNQSTFNKAVNMYVPLAQFATDVGVDGVFRVDYGAPVAANATGILSAQSIAVALTVLASGFQAAYTDVKQGTPNGYGRNVQVVASGAATSTQRVDGRDWLGQKLSETFTLNGATPVLGKKAFAKVDQVVILTTTAATTTNVGWGDKLGIPYAATALLASLENGITATAGTLVTKDSTNPATATTGDTRGTITFSSATDGTRTFAGVFVADRTNLYGLPHFAA